MIDSYSLVKSKSIKSKKAQVLRAPTNANSIVALTEATKIFKLILSHHDELLNVSPAFKSFVIIYFIRSISLIQIMLFATVTGLCRKPVLSDCWKSFLMVVTKVRTSFLDSNVLS